MSESNTTAVAPTAEQLRVEYPLFVADLFNRTGDLSKDFAHAILGIVTETHELRDATSPLNALEEAGDLDFFGQALTLVAREYLDGTFDDAAAQKAVDTVDAALASTQPIDKILKQFKIDLLDATKKWVGYGKKPADLYEVLAKADVVVSYAMLSAQLAFGGDLADEVKRRSANIRKLLLRHKGRKFSADCVLVRDLQAEAAALQG